MNKNKVTLLCFRDRIATLCALLAPAVSVCSGAGSVQRVVKAPTSVVRADARTGKLVRTVIVPPKAVAPKVVPSMVVGDTPTEEPVVPVAASSELSALVDEAASKYKVDPLLVHSVIQVESNYNQYAVSNKGAQGLMQLIPSTARRFGVKNAFDAKENIEGGVRYLQYLHSLFPDDLRKTIAAYNAGEAAVARYNNIPPYRETEQYVYLVGEKYGKALRARKKAESAAKPVVKASVEDRPNPVEQFVDADGRLHLVTRINTDNP